MLYIQFNKRYFPSHIRVILSTVHRVFFRFNEPHESHPRVDVAVACLRRPQGSLIVTEQPPRFTGNIPADPLGPRIP